MDFKQEALFIYLETDSHVVFVDDASLSVIASITQHKSPSYRGTKANIDTATFPFPRWFFAERSSLRFFATTFCDVFFSTGQCYVVGKRSWQQRRGKGSLLSVICGANQSLIQIEARFSFQSRQKEGESPWKRVSMAATGCFNNDDSNVKETENKRLDSGDYFAIILPFPHPTMLAKHVKLDCKERHWTKYIELNIPAKLSS